jgi:preprotein translocase SecE subunit
VSVRIRPGLPFLSPDRARIEEVGAIASEKRAGGGRSGRWARLKGFFRDAWLELQKVIWPSQEEVAKMTGLVVVVVVVVGTFIFTWDRVVLQITRAMFR